MYFCSDQPDFISFLKKLTKSKRCFFIIDINVYNSHDFEYLINSSSEIIIHEFAEEKKSFITVFSLIDKLIALSAVRSDLLVAIGGGVTSDIVGLVAGLYMRGLKWVSVPTTMLSIVDAGIGGKTGVNYSGVKNLIGIFNPPLSTVINTKFLDTLFEEQYLFAYAEVIKYGVICDKNFFEFLFDNISSLINREENCLQYVIKRCCEIKQEIIDKDLYDHHERLILNFGHTFGHAIESYYNFTNISHPEAVSLGMLLAAFLALKLEMFKHEHYIQLERLLAAFSLPTDITKLREAIPSLLTIMESDKKVVSGQVRLILPIKIGKVQLVTMTNKHREILYEYASEQTET